MGIGGPDVGRARGERVATRLGKRSALHVGAVVEEDGQRQRVGDPHAEGPRRVGRGAEQSYCLLISRPKEELTDAAQARLEALVETSDGFELADRDLDLRGEGQLLGTRQSGLSDLRFTRLRADRPLIERARSIARDLGVFVPKEEAVEVLRALLDAWKEDLTYRVSRVKSRMTWSRAKASAASVPGNGWRCRSATLAVPVRMGSTAILVPGASPSQCSWACGAEADGLAPQTMMQAASRAVRGSSHLVMSRRHR